MQLQVYSISCPLPLAVGRAMGGTSGAIYKIFLLAAAASLQRAPPGPLTLASVAAAMAEGAAAVSKHGGAVRGSRTMLDALLPAADALQAAVQAGAQWSQFGPCDSTAGKALAPSLNLGCVVQAPGQQAPRPLQLWLQRTGRRRPRAWRQRLGGLATCLRRRSRMCRTRVPSRWHAGWRRWRRLCDKRIEKGSQDWPGDLSTAP